MQLYEIGDISDFLMKCKKGINNRFLFNKVIYYDIYDGGKK